MGKLFGTDGIRGVANVYPMTPDMALKVGQAVACYFRKGNEHPRIVVGKDTRASGDMLESALVAGICSGGADAWTTGVLPTPGIAFVAKDMGVDAALVISASHNPFQDNGVKVFRGDGFKLSDDAELEIEKYILDTETRERALRNFHFIGRVYSVADAQERYIGFLTRTMPTQRILDGLSLVLDCANGATSIVAPTVFRQLGATVRALCYQPDGKNINDDCGSEHMGKLSHAVPLYGAHAGFAFDGDGDRVLCVDEKGGRVSGDKMLAICAKEFKKQGRLANNAVVSTVMSNIGLGLALRAMDVNHVTSQVGDRYVLQEMLRTGARVGSEDSGHMIFLDYHTTGDGIIAALKIAQIMKETGNLLSTLADVMKVYPQILINVSVREKPVLDTHPVIAKVIKRVKNALGDEGRVLARYSGTQPMCRVMVEGPTREITEKYCREIAEVVRHELG